MLQSSLPLLDVVYLAKVQISKQITTDKELEKTATAMLFTLQRYKFLSKSQQRVGGCVVFYDVVYLAKVQISKQITTIAKMNNEYNLMLFTLQRYKFLSKSQQAGIPGIVSAGCCLPCKGTNF